MDILATFFHLPHSGITIMVNGSVSGDKDLSCSTNSWVRNTTVNYTCTAKQPGVKKVTMQLTFCDIDFRSSILIFIKEPGKNIYNYCWYFIEGIIIPRMNKIISVPATLKQLYHLVEWCCQHCSTALKGNSCHNYCIVHLNSPYVCNCSIYFSVLLYYGTVALLLFNFIAVLQRVLTFKLTYIANRQSTY